MPGECVGDAAPRQLASFAGTRPNPRGLTGMSTVVKLGGCSEKAHPASEEAHHRRTLSRPNSSMACCTFTCLKSSCSSSR